jgi:hypothetical protein
MLTMRVKRYAMQQMQTLQAQQILVLWQVM